MVTYQSANQLKTPAKFPWAFKMVSQFGSLGYTITEKTADMTVVQKTIIDTLHMESKPQTFIAKEAGCSQSVVSKHVNRNLSGRKLKKKMHNQPRELQPYEDCQAKSIQEFEWISQRMDWGWGQDIKSNHTQTCQGIWLQLSSEASYLGAKEKKNWTVAQWSKFLFSDESKFCISFGNKGPRVWREGGEAHSPSCLKSSVKFPQSVMIWRAMSSAGVGPLCFLKTNVTAPIYQEMLEHFMLPSADQLFKDAVFIFQQDLAPAHTAKSTKSWLNDHGVVCLTGQQTHQTWTP